MRSVLGHGREDANLCPLVTDPYCEDLRNRHQHGEESIDYLAVGETTPAVPHILSG